MKKSALILIATGFLVLSQDVFSQFFRTNDRTWHAIRGGVILGLNMSRHTGEVPLIPSPQNSTYTDGSGLNVLFGAHLEKAFSRALVMGVRVMYDPMSGEITSDVTEPFRISDAQGNVYDVVREQKTEYALRYFTVGWYTKVYPLGGPGLFAGGGLNYSALLDESYENKASILEPEWARGSQSKINTGDLTDVNSHRYSATIILGYDYFFTYGFVSPEIHYSIGLNKVVDASWAESWRVDNLSFLVVLSFPIP